RADSADGSTARTSLRPRSTFPPPRSSPTPCSNASSEPPAMRILDPAAGNAGRIGMEVQDRRDQRRDKQIVLTVRDGAAECGTTRRPHVRGFEACAGPGIAPV